SVPFPICIANFFADDTLNQIVKSQWHFLYGTPSEQAALGCRRFVPHPFAPEVFTRGVTEICERDAIPKDRIAYVSQEAVECLPDNLSQFSAFVLLPFDDWEKRLLPTKAASAENIPCYRLPLDQHIRGVSRNIPCWLVANILREVYIGRMSWAKAAQHWGQELTHRPNADQSGPEQLPFCLNYTKVKKK
uniref:SAM-dependent methyltransferase n=1 Tax=Globodera pallida TaxID=36090 RepID=A0A183CSH3_GLOPA